MICPRCGEMNPPGAEQCTVCGANLPSSRMIVCEGCGTENPRTNRFCQGCGRLLSRPEVAFHREEVEPEVEEEPSRSLPLTYILLVVLLVLAALTLLVYFMSR
ncbi:MAG: zinc ribbon domain-containing protein [Anaerolineae bacterium]